MSRKLFIGGFSALSLVAHVVALFLFWVDTCGTFDDTGGPFPADYSPQGRICFRDGGAPWLDAVAIVVLVVSLVLGIMVVVLASRRGVRTTVAVVIVALALPVAADWALAVPSDECSAAEQRADRRDHCVTSN